MKKEEYTFEIETIYHKSIEETRMIYLSVMDSIIEYVMAKYNEGEDIKAYSYEFGLVSGLTWTLRFLALNFNVLSNELVDKRWVYKPVKA